VIAICQNSHFHNENTIPNTYRGNFHVEEHLQRRWKTSFGDLEAEYFLGLAETHRY